MSAKQSEAAARSRSASNASSVKGGGTGSSGVAVEGSTNVNGTKVAPMSQNAKEFVPTPLHAPGSNGLPDVYSDQKDQHEYNPHPLGGNPIGMKVEKGVTYFAPINDVPTENFTHNHSNPPPLQMEGAVNPYVQGHANSYDTMLPPPHQVPYQMHNDAMAHPPRIHAPAGPPPVIMNPYSGGRNPLIQSNTTNRKSGTPQVGPFKKGGGIVVLNIGGYTFHTTRGTLISGRSPNYFTSLLNNQDAILDKNGAYFIDRDGQYFPPILTYLRTGTMPSIPEHMLYEDIVREAHFYSIPLPAKKHQNCRIAQIIYTQATDSDKEYCRTKPSNIPGVQYIGGYVAKDGYCVDSFLATAHLTNLGYEVITITKSDFSSQYAGEEHTVWLKKITM